MIWLVGRSGFRSRWASLIGLAVLVAVVVAVVLTAAAGARRTSTALERFRDRTHSSDAGIQTNVTGGAQARAILAELHGAPEVEHAAARYLVNGYPDGADPSTTDFAVMSDPDGRYGVDVDRMHLLDGRMPDPNSPDEIVLTEQTAQTLRLSVGDHVGLKTFSEADLDALTSGGFNGFNGPRMDLTVVGIGRTPDELQGDLVRNSLFALAAPTFIAAHPGVGAWPPAVTVELRDGDAGVGSLRTRVARVMGAEAGGGIDIARAAQLYADGTQRAITAASAGLVVVAFVAGAAGLLVIGQALSRQVTSNASTAALLRSLGAERRSRAVAVSVASVLAGIIGIVVGLIGAVALSPLLPTGLAQRAEVDPGVRIDPATFALGALVMTAFVVAVPILVALRWDHRRNVADTHPATRATTADRLAGWGAPAAVVIGVRRAFPRRSTTALPARAAVVAVAFAVTGMVAAGAVVASLGGLTGHPDRWGWNWSSRPEPVGDAAMTGDAMTVAVRQVPGIQAIGTMYETTFRVGEHAVDGFAMEQDKGHIDFTLTAGRMPATDSEVALSPGAMTELGVTTGDLIRAMPGDGAGDVTRLRVVGTVVVPTTESESTDNGAVVTPATLGALTAGEDRSADGAAPEGSIVLRYAPGADAGRIEARLTETAGVTFPAYARPQLPGSIRNVDQSRGIAVALAGFLGVLAVAALVHTLVLTGRRQRSETAVFRAIGFRGSQLRSVVESHALATTVVGLVVGVPAGLVLGQLVWRRLVDGIGADVTPTTPWLVLLAIAPVALAVSALVAWPSALAASRTRPAAALRAD